jgi:ABC-type polysaccharide/polyol phosphate export permease
MSRIDELRDTVVGTLIPVAALSKTKEKLFDPDYSEFFPRVYFIGVALSVVSGVGTGVFYISMSIFDYSSNLDLFSGAANALAPIAVILLIGAFFFTDAVEATVEGEGKLTGEQWLSQRPVFQRLNLSVSQTVNGVVNYLFGVLVFWIALTMRELLRPVSLIPDGSTSILFSFAHGLLVLLLEFGYIGLLLMSIGQIVIGVSMFSKGGASR